MKRVVYFIVSVVLVFGLYYLTNVKEEEVVVFDTYPVEDGKLVNEVEFSEDEEVWRKIKELFPKKYLDLITSFEVMSDGKDGELAAVSLNDDGKTWTIRVDLEDVFAENGEFEQEGIVTLVHEMSHIISLNYEQMSDSSDVVYTVDEGNLRDDSYLSLFYQRFYEGHEYVSNDAFVSEYARTNPEEDFAESFAYFVMEEKPDGNLVKDMKMLFFYDFDELVKIRKDIRSKLNLNFN